MNEVITTSHSHIDYFLRWVFKAQAIYMYLPLLIVQSDKE